MPTIDPFVDLVPLVPRRVSGRPSVVGLTGSVAVGKSTFAEGLAARLRAEDPTLVVSVVSTDGFLLSTADLDARGLGMRKGFPESFDLPALVRFLDRVRRGEDGLQVPVYDHFTYDVEPDAVRAVPRSDVLILEGLVVLEEPVAERLDLAIYLDADEADIERWFTERFLTNARRARDEPGGFWDLFAGFDDGQLRDAAALTWSMINLPNLRDHIAPTRRRADVIITKDPHHGVLSCERTH